MAGATEAIDVLDRWDLHELPPADCSARLLALRRACQFVGYVGEESPVEWVWFEEEKSSCSKRALSRPCRHLWWQPEPGHPWCSGPKNWHWATGLAGSVWCRLPLPDLQQIDLQTGTEGACIEAGGPHLHRLLFGNQQPAQMRERPSPAGSARCCCERLSRCRWRSCGPRGRWHRAPARRRGWPGRRPQTARL